jgi:hypothetical protein
MSSAAAVLVAACPIIAAAQERTKTFDAQNCKYTLPADNWVWLDATAVPGAICAARGSDGVTFVLGARKVRPNVAMTDKFVTGFDQGAAEEGGKKRGGRMTTFKGQACYETEGLINGNMTTAQRVVIANGLAYMVQVVAGADPVEKRSDYEAIMNGFEFITPPVAASNHDSGGPTDPFDKAAYRLGQAVGFCLMLAAGLAVFGFFRKRK